MPANATIRSPRSAATASPTIATLHMLSAAKDFEVQLELFRTEAESAIQYFYAWNTVHTIAAKNKAVRQFLNEAPLFWNTNLGALQTSTFVALGRVFDPDTKNHSVTRLLKFAHENLNIFSKHSLAERKRAGGENSADWLPSYLESVYEPSSDDFRKLKRHLSDRRKIYEANYRPLRHKVFAHRGVTTRVEVGELFAKANIQEMQKLLVFLGRLHEVLWQLYFNGTKPTLKPARSSVKKILEQPSPTSKQRKLQERLIHETTVFLTTHARHA
jgi:AbiU2